MDAEVVYATLYFRKHLVLAVFDRRGASEEEEDGREDASDGFGFESIGYARPYRDLPGDEDDF